MLVLERGDVEIARWPLAGRVPPGLSILDALARWQLAARRSGCSIRVVDADAALRGLLALVGLDEVIPLCCSGGEVGGQPEHLEQPRVEEAVLPGDPAV